ncbi:MAG: glycosyltransferase family 2 protein [Mucilaginibacter sp.]|uniref:glycosyltransferase family 2 protein n=1 Tax=Mucilaginibacter sp. TaxID=1882438 RepID=UPI003267E03E
MSKSTYLSLCKIQSQKASGKPYLISIAVRVMNELGALSLFWESLVKQTIYNNLEITFLDSGSTDGTLELLQTYNCNIYTITKNEFRFGDSCNLMMELTNSQLVYFFSGHIILEDPSLLEDSYLFIKDDIGSGYFRQIPNKILGYSNYDKAFLKNRFPRYPLSSPIRIVKKHSFSNAAAIINRAHWELVKFEDVLFGEDEIWAEAVLKKQGKLYYFHAYNILHSHNDSYDDVYKRVSMAAKVKFPNGINVFKLGYIFAKVFAAVFLSSMKLKSSLKYAYAHSKAYKDIKK